MSDDKNITLQIDGESVTVPEGATLLDAARSLGVDIGHLTISVAAEFDRRGVYLFLHCFFLLFLACRGGTRAY